MAGLLAAEPAHAQDLVVDGGSVGGLCSDVRGGAADAFRTPYCTIGAAVRDAPPGATVLVRRGSYGRVTLSGINPSTPVTIRPYPGERPTVGGMDIRDSSRLVVRGLRFSSGILAIASSSLHLVGNEMALIPRGARTDSGFIVNQVKGVLIEDNHVHDGRDGVNFDDSEPPSSQVAIVGNHFEDLGNDAIHISNDQHDILVARNVIEDCLVRRDVDPEAHADGIQAMGPTRNVHVLSNYVVGGRGFLFMVSPRDVARPDRAHEGLVIANNVFTGRDFGIRLFSTRGARVVNNTVWGSQPGAGGGLDVRDRIGEANAPTTGLVMANNIVRRLDVVPGVGFAMRDHNLIADGPRQGPRDVGGSPEFVDLRGGDLRLRPSSPGVDAGNADVAPLVDFDGRGRRGAPDMGAFEVGGTVLPGAVAAPSPASPQPAAQPAPEPVGLPPVIDDLAIAPGRFSERSVVTPPADLSPRGSLGPPGGATLAWRTATPSLAFVRIDRRFRGHRRRGTCVRANGPRGRKTPCTVVKHVAFLVRVAMPGVTTAGLTARVGRVRLRPGAYGATLALLDGLGRASETRSVRFRITRP